ncbi:Ribulosamine/erythrulosamine 3-kinase potentially involved in protein deglycation [hydrothermal vent metagenome]|uniref:Ribulosamine/erythrulosamine 3-kinase potentially involved in protein deglycation n=1 Tax=hydrothermal vent metagenome TaxID=652676 RepID=A0A3B0WBK4_9ZZZZ
MAQWENIVQHIEEVTGNHFSIKQTQSLSGGSINAAYMLSGENGQQYFVKTNQPDRKDMFAAEVEGLVELAESNALKVPKPVCFGSSSNQSYIVMEYLFLKGLADPVLLGEQLASMHKVTADQFGWRINNTIGATPQPNAWQSDWVEFWCKQRLGYQLELAAKNGYGGELQVLGEKLLLNMHKLFEGRNIKPSMLHGDLWGGNVAGLADGTPVIFDPAFYYGDRETDLAMTYVFGGFTADFYAAYQYAFPLDDGFEVRKVFYNIYHIINHLNLFGGGYREQAVDMMGRVLAEI